MKGKDWEQFYVVACGFEYLQRMAFCGYVQNLQSLKIITTSGMSLKDVATISLFMAT